MPAVAWKWEVGGYGDFNLREGLQSVDRDSNALSNGPTFISLFPPFSSRPPTHPSPGLLSHDLDPKLRTHPLQLLLIDRLQRLLRQNRMSVRLAQSGQQFRQAPPARKDVHFRDARARHRPERGISRNVGELACDESCVADGR
nr:hypothetical protein CFP56_16741 [Quercus suber]